MSNNPSTVTDAISALSELLDKARTKIIKLEECQKTIPFANLKSREVLYRELATASERLNANQRTLSCLTRTKAQIRALRGKCRADSFSSLRQAGMLQIDELERSVQELIEATRALEKGFETHCRFLHTAQFIMSSQYLND